ncbi:semialdehyde dehydrogenase [Baekduia soli]|uniref:Semialdehyde dehydrogenase n=1 Tax=Baekduia soli TaxID=496014 RepID=A0A5B8U1A7_9ACTN|nr:phosphogluconate dehydrogenase C-terminal domain-containing protein [Baekduia soli]QEC46757.1 semialdehyde dehydrogenase [Baekduia soli]
MSTVAIIGAAGVQGAQVGDRLRAAGHDVRLVETGDGVQKLRDRGLEPTTLEDAGRDADAVILAVPDGAIKTVAAAIEQALAPGTVMVALDAAAPFAAPLCARDDLSVFVAHPCHPSMFTTALGPDGRRDYNGGIVPQDIVCCLASGDESAYAVGEELARDMFAPVARSFRITLDQFILLEPTLSETTAATLLLTIREAMEEAVARGVPADVAKAFMEGHIMIELAIFFGELDASFSISADYAVEQARDKLLAPDWRSVFEPDQVRAVAEAIADGKVPAVRIT